MRLSIGTKASRAALLGSVALTALLALPAPAFAGNGPYPYATGGDPMEDGSYLRVELHKLEVDEDGYEYDSSDSYYLYSDCAPDYNYELRSVPGGKATYDKSSNTLVLSGLNADATIFADSMGEDFTIKVTGSNSIRNIDTYGDGGWGSGLSIVGNGTLTVNKDRSASYPIYVYGGSAAKSKLTVAPTVNLNIYAEDNYDYLAMVYDTSITRGDQAMSFGGNHAPVQVTFDGDEASDNLDYVNTYEVMGFAPADVYEVDGKLYSESEDEDYYDQMRFYEIEPCGTLDGESTAYRFKRVEDLYEKIPADESIDFSALTPTSRLVAYWPNPQFTCLAIEGDSNTYYAGEVRGTDPETGYTGGAIESWEIFREAGEVKDEYGDTRVGAVLVDTVDNIPGTGDELDMPEGYPLQTSINHRDALYSFSLKGSSFTQTAKARPAPAASVKAGQTVDVSGQSFEVGKVASGSAAGEVTFTKAKNAKSVAVPDTVKLADGKTYKVTKVAAKAFTGKKVRTVTIGKNVKKIAKNAFKGSKATKVIVKTKALKKSSVKGCFSGAKVKTVQVKVGNKKANKAQVKKYKKVFTKKNTKTKAKALKVK